MLERDLTTLDNLIEKIDQKATQKTLIPIVIMYRLSLFIEHDLK